MALAWSRRSLSRERSPASQRPPCCSRGQFAKHRASWLAALLLTLALGGVSEAAIDLTGDWYVAVYAANHSDSTVELIPFVQTGTSLSAGFDTSGSVDPATGSFFLFFFPGSFGYFCGAGFRAQVSMDGNTFTGTMFTAGPPPDCHSPTCFCAAEVPVGPLYGSRSPCGNGIVDAGEACDDGSVGRSGACCSLDCAHPVGPAGQGCIDDGDLCTSDICDATGTCTHPVGPDGQPCDEDYNFCTSDVCDAAGTCTHPTLPAGTNCESDANLCTSDVCDAAGTCTHVPQTCRAAERSLLLVKNKSDSARNTLVWRWTKGAQTSQAEFADPTGTTDYALCIFAGTVSPMVDEAVIPASATKWRALGTKGYKYADAAADDDGIDEIVLKGSTRERSRVLVKGKGAGLPDLPLPIDAPLTVQLVNGDNGLCWGASYSGSQLLKNEMGQLKAKAP